MFGQNRKSVKALILTALFFSALISSPAFAIPTPAASPYARCISEGKLSVKKGQTAKAVEKFQAAVNADPTSCEAHFLLGQSYCQLKEYTKAKQHFRAAIRAGKGSKNAQQANLAMMQLPKNMLSPKTGPDTRMIASMLGLSRVRGADGSSKPTVIDFYAPWCQPCRQMDSLLDKVKSTYGDRVSFMRVDVDDPNNEKIIDQYEVSPIPTIVFLNPEGEVVTFSIGFSGEKGIDEGIKKILPNKG